MRVADANDLDMLERAFKTFKATTDRPTLIIVDSHIAWGVPGKEGPSFGPRRAARLEGGLPGQGVLWLSVQGRRSRRPTPPMPRMKNGRSGCSRTACSTASTTPSPRASASAARRLRDAWFAEAGSVQGQVTPSWPMQLEKIQQRELPDGWDKDMPSRSRRRTPRGMGGRNASPEGPEHDRSERAVADRRCGRPGALDENAA